MDDEDNDEEFEQGTNKNFGASTSMHTEIFKQLISFAESKLGLFLIVVYSCLTFASHNYLDNVFF